MGSLECAGSTPCGHLPSAVLFAALTSRRRCPDAAATARRPPRPFPSQRVSPPPPRLGSHYPVFFSSEAACLLKMLHFILLTFHTFIQHVFIVSIHHYLPYILFTSLWVLQLLSPEPCPPEPRILPLTCISSPIVLSWRLLFENMGRPNGSVNRST